MAYRRATATRNIVADPEGNALNGGSIQGRTGAQPTNVDDAAQGTLLLTWTLPATVFGAASDGVKTANAIDSTTVVASGTIGHTRLLTSAPAIHSDATCGQGEGDFNFDNNELVEGGTAEISSLTLTAPV